MSACKKGALFICLGNICRSPIAEAVFLEMLKKNNLSQEWEVDSAALGSWHVGGSPDQRTKMCLKSHNIDYKHTVRQIKQEDFLRFDYIFGMDEENMTALDTLAPINVKSKLCLLGDFDPNGERIIRDPYYDRNDAGFEKCYQQCVRCCAAFLDTV